MLVEELYEQIGNILGLRDVHDAIIVGAGHLGHALANHGGFAKRGFNISALFDIDAEKIGTKINGVVVKDMSELEEVIDTIKEIGSTKTSVILSTPIESKSIL